MREKEFLPNMYLGEGEIGAEAITSELECMEIGRKCMEMYRNVCKCMEIGRSDVATPLIQ